MELVPSPSGSTGNSPGFDSLCFLNVFQLSFELLLR